MTALAYFATHHPLLAFASWIALACWALSLFEAYFHLDTEHL